MTTYTMIVQVKEGGLEFALPAREALTLVGSLEDAAERAIDMCKKNGWWAFTLFSDASGRASYADCRPFSKFKARKRTKKADLSMLPGEYLPPGEIAKAKR